ncbi:nuclease [Sulfolobus sp. A20]|uniref:DNA double-strand break repair nuclease NurA n=1 Tax=Sulfolobaceae TaxID=118883 RepID=UPI00084608E3|nr:MULTISPECIES: DNA double-strand break repair nuclease NurA [unclassified Sulfolobus]TRM76059.1 nuclease [Sulfolobus sp. E5]TRM81085.1 nuclease [Sulfolobus sp. D5]TRM86333.1 nuclease [Sulfolobus sp. C3]TRM93694.1 nuclease [Sulfolobus sp. A20-N-G8]TRN00892.1 nuclease [Sulfolobus sp. E1]
MNINDILAKINEMANRDIEQLSKLKTFVNLIYDDIVNGSTDINIKFLEAKDNTNHVACSIDGSKYEIELSDITLIIARAVRIIGHLKDNKGIPSSILEDFRIIENYYDKNIISNKSILFMLSLETRLLETCEECDVIFLDGPIVDPPTYYEEDIDLEGIMSLGKLAMYRSLLIKNLLDNRKKIFGIVKNFSHRIMTKKFISNGFSVLSKARESYLVGNIIYRFRLENNEFSKPVFLGWINWDLLMDHNNTLDDLKGISKAYENYKRNLGDFSIYSAYYQYDANSPLARLDVVYRLEPKIEDIKYVNTWAIARTEEITLLNKLADDFSEIKFSEARNYATLFKLMRDNYLDAKDKLIELMMKSKI